MAMRMRESQQQSRQQHARARRRRAGGLPGYRRVRGSCGGLRGGPGGRGAAEEGGADGSRNPGGF